MDQYSPDAIAARMEITDVLYYYCRGVDRHDKAALARVYWPDSFDDHIALKVSGPEFAAEVITATAEMRTSHHLTNILIELTSASQARVEICSRSAARNGASWNGPWCSTSSRPIRRACGTPVGSSS
jgi:hypothetical protein